MTDSLILTINSGSSSIKASLHRIGTEEELIADGQLEGIGRNHGRFRMKDATGQALVDHHRDLADHSAALHSLFDWLAEQTSLGQVNAVGHRLVHGGTRYLAPHPVTSELLDEVRKLVPFAPLHLPSEVTAIEIVARLFPTILQVACFDTAFHRTLPEVARTFAIPRRFTEQGIYRFGFHGLSYEYIMEELARLDAPAAKGCVVICHLGSGCSMAAVRQGVCLDTTMGLTALGGLVMATRSGDLDPSILLYLLAKEKMSVPDLMRLLNVESGLLGLSGLSADMRELLQQEPSNPAAKLAIDVFCYQARKFIGALAAGLGGLETLVFTAGIGEHSATIRERIGAGLGVLGVELDESRNAAGHSVISTAASRASVRVIPTNEELMIARHTHRFLGGSR